jgi:surface antigen/uncharacterized protein YukE
MMSNVSHGMNVQEVEALAATLARSADTMAQIANQLGSSVQRTTWAGPDATRFKNQWWPEHSNSLRRVSELLREFSNAARANLDDQRRVSDAGGLQPMPAPIVPPVHVDPTPPSAGSQGDVTAPRDWRDVKQRYDQWAGNGFWSQPDFRYQCTGWAHFRWAELGYDGPAFKGNGGALADNAPGEVSGTPSLHAMASYGRGVEGDYGHVMIVEEVAPDGSWIRVSEMNTGNDWNVGRPEEYRDTGKITRSPDGTFQRNGKVIRFAAFPG